MQRLPRSTWRDVRYKGDPLTRPIASYELGPLVRLLVALSMRLNAWLALDRPWTPQEDPPENRVQVGGLGGLGWGRGLFWLSVGFWRLARRYAYVARRRSRRVEALGCPTLYAGKF